MSSAMMTRILGLSAARAGRANDEPMIVASKSASAKRLLFQTSIRSTSSDAFRFEESFTDSFILSGRDTVLWYNFGQGGEVFTTCTHISEQRQNLESRE